MLTYLLESCLGDLVLILHPNATDPQSVEKLATTNDHVVHHLIFSLVWTIHQILKINWMEVWTFKGIFIFEPPND